VVCVVESVVQSHAKIVVGSDEKKLIRVVHVDDELGFLKVAKQCLEIQGPFHVDTAGSVEEALNKLKEKEYDAVVSDYQMPGKDGLEFLKELREKGNGIPFIMFTGKGREEAAAKALNLGADQYLNKAGNPETVYQELAHDITWAVDKKRSEKALRESLTELNLVLSTLEEGVDIVGYDYAVQYQNKLLKDRFGDLTGKTCYAGYMGSKEPCPFCPMRKAIELKKTFRVELTGKDGRNYEIVSTPLEREDGGIDALEVVRDVTERKKAEQESFDRQIMLQSVFDASPNALLIIDLNGKILDCNEQALEIFGYSSKSELVGRSALESIAEGDLQRAMENMEKTLKQGLMRNEEYTIVAKDNSKCALSVSASVLRDASWNPIGFVSAIEDLSSRKKMEETLRKSGAKYRALVEQSVQGIVIAHAQGSIPHIVFANSSMSEILGYTVEELTSLSPQQTIGLVHPDDRELFFGRFKDRLEGKSAPAQYEVRGIRKDGTIVWLELSSARIECDEQPAIQAIFTDITERKKTEQTLKESEEKYRGLVELAPDGIVAVNTEGIITSANRSFLALVGYDSAEEIVGKPFTELTTMQIEDIPKFQQMFKSLLKGESPSPSEFLYVRRDGTSRWAEVHPSLIAKDGHFVGVQAIMRDVSERKNAEKLNQENQQKFEQLFMSNPEAAVYVDPNERVLNVNPRFTELFGYSFGEVKGRFLDDFVVPEDLRKEALMLAQKGKKGYVYHETVRKNKEGSLIPVTLFSAPIVLQGQHLGDIVLYDDISERRKAEEQKDRLAYGLNERVKELTCLYGLSKIIAKHGDSIDEIMQDTVSLLPPAYQYPDIACARIVWEDCKYITGNFRETRWSQKTDIKVCGEIVGAVEVYYLQEKSDRDKKLFLKEEKNLLDAVAERMGRVIERIRERALRQNEERESQRKFEGLFRHNPEAAVYLDQGFRIVDLNPRFCQLFGYSAEEIKGRNINDVVAPERLKEEAERLDKDAKDGYASHDTVRKRKDGSLVPVSISAAPVTFENNLLGYVGIYKDITELKRAQEESEESRKHFQMLFDLMADPVAVVDGRGKILEVTRKVEEITGFKREELVGKNLLKVEMFGAKTKAVMIKGLAKRMMGMHLQPYEVEVLKKDGGKLMYEINAAKIDYKGEPADLVVFRDILERKNLEEKLRVVGSLTRHDVRNKLSAVTGNAYLLRRKLAGNPEALEQLADMENAVRNVEAIFEFARTYEKLGVEQLVNMNVGKAVDEAASLFTDLKGVRIANECGGLTVIADSLLRQLFYNLIDDSLKYGEKLTQIRVRYEEFEDKLKLIYEDDGVGIPCDAKSKLFTEGFTTGKGSGYGLYLIRRITEVYGWTISETGTHGKGAQFTIDIPKAKPDGRQNYKLN